MASNGKKKTTMAKISRENRLRERRADKQARKDARKEAQRLGVTVPDDAHLEGDVREDGAPGPADAE